MAGHVRVGGEPGTTTLENGQADMPFADEEDPPLQGLRLVW